MYRCLLLLLASPFLGCTPEPIGPQPEPFTCNFGFLTDVSNEVCSCPADHVNLGSLECRRLTVDEFYTEMENCYVDLGMIVKFGDSVRVFSDRRSAIDVYVEDPDTASWSVHAEQPKFNKVSGILSKTASGKDSIQWDIQPREYARIFPGNEYAYSPWFTGYLIGTDTIRGTIHWGPGGEERTPVAELDCPVTFIRSDG